MSTSKPRKPTTPSGLGTAGRKLWTEIVGIYDLRADELRALEDACASTDMLATLEKEWIAAGRPFMSKGSMGQQVEHPLIGSIDKLRKSRQAFLRQLKLPDDPAGDVPEAGAPAQAAGDDRAVKARAAAQARWSRRGA
jgi:hypothetical protein